MFFRILMLSFAMSFSFGQYDYSLEDINTSSLFFGENVGTTYFSNDVTLHYFGHYN